MMEIEVSKKIREAIKAKLIEMGSHVDDELPDYIMILIANRRSQQDLEADLQLFLTDNTKKFVNWLSNVLKKLEQVTADATGGSGGGSDEINIDGDDEEEIGGGGEEIATVPEVTMEEEAQEPPVVEEPKVVNAENLKQGKSGEEKRSRKRSSTTTVETVTKVEEKKVQEIPQTKKKLSLKRNDVVKVQAASPALTTTTKVSTVSKPPAKEKVQVTTTTTPPPMEDLHADTLILDTEENEFDSVENVDELRRIALQSQEERKQRKNSVDKNPVPKTVHQRTLIKSILLGRVKEDRDSSNSPRMMARTTPPTRSSRDKEPTRNRSSRPESSYNSASSSSSTSRREASYSSRSSSNRGTERSPIVKILRSPRRKVRSPERSGSGFGGDTSQGSSTNNPSPGSVFSRIGRSTRRSKTRSRSPIRTMTSKIGSVIRRSSSPEEDSSTIRNSVSSVVKVTSRPKRDLQLSGKMLLRAVADAQQSIIKTEQNSPTPRTPSSDKHKQVREENQTPHRKRPNSESPKQTEISPKLGRFVNNSSSTTNNFYRNTNEMSMEDSPTPRISVKERLGVKQEQPRRSVKERLGVIQNFTQNSSDPYEIETYSPGCDYKILVNVSDDTNAIHQRNVLLAANDLKRISIQVNNSEEDSSDESSNGSPTSQPVSLVNLDVKRKNEKRMVVKESAAYLGGSDSELQLVMSEEDKLPEVPNGTTEVVEEEYEEEYEEIVEEEDEENTNGSSTQDLSQTSTMSSQENSVSITINKVVPSNPVTTLKTSLPDLRTIMSRAKPSPMSPSVTNNNNNNGTSTLKCKFWPSCQFKDKCIYEHPKCKFDPCTKKDCIYKHEVALAPQKASQTGGKIVCKWYPKCTSMNCKFHHPSPCRFGMGCTDARCENYHPGVHLGMQKLKAKGVPLIPKGNQLKWVKK